MKKLKFITVLILLTFGLFLSAQQNQFPSAELYTLDGTLIDANSITESDIPIIVVFWKTNDNNSLDDLNVAYDFWQKQIELNLVKLVAINIDCNGKTQHIKPFVLGHGIEAEVYIDKNGDFKRKMCISDTPNTFVFDQVPNIHCSQSGLCTMTEDLLFEEVNMVLQNVFNK